MIVFERLGRDDAARDLRKRHIDALSHLDRVPEDMRARILLANNYAFLGNEFDAMRQLDVAIELCPHDSNILYNAACTYGILQKKDEALRALKRAVAAGFMAVEYVEPDPDLSCLWQEPEFQKLLSLIRQKKNSDPSRSPSLHLALILTWFFLLRQ